MDYKINKWTYLILKECVCETSKNCYIEQIKVF